MILLKCGAKQRVHIRLELPRSPHGGWAGGGRGRAVRPSVCPQIALRAVREMSLPDSCADLLISDIENEW